MKALYHYIYIKYWQWKLQRLGTKLARRCDVVLKEHDLKRKTS